MSKALDPYQLPSTKRDTYSTMHLVRCGQFPAGQPSHVLSPYFLSPYFCTSAYIFVQYDNICGVSSISYLLHVLICHQLLISAKQSRIDLVGKFLFAISIRAILSNFFLHYLLGLLACIYSLPHTLGFHAHHSPIQLFFFV